MNRNGFPRKPRNNPDEHSPGSDDCQHHRQDAERDIDSRDAVQVDQFEQTAHHRGTVERRQSQRHCKSGTEPEQCQEILELGGEEAAVLVHGLPHGRQSLAQFRHPPQSCVERAEDTEDADARPRLDRSVDESVDRFAQTSRNVLRDLVADLVEQLRLARQHESGCRERHHQERKKRQHTEVGHRGGVIVAILRFVPLRRADRVIEPRPLLAAPLQDCFEVGNDDHPLDVCPSKLGTRCEFPAVRKAVPGTPPVRTPASTFVTLPPSPGLRRLRGCDPARRCRPYSHRRRLSAGSRTRSGHLPCPT